MIRVVEDVEALSELAAATVADVVLEAVRRRGRCTLALAGGDTPRGCYRLLSRKHRSDLPWSGVHLFWGDERMVPANHPDSNQRMVRTELLASLEIPENNLHPITTSPGSAEEAAARYGEEIRRFFALAEGQLPRLDLVLLGLGEDGHAASLFPGCPALEERSTLAASCRPDRAEHERVTLTLPVLNAAAAVMFLVSGERKAQALRKVLEPDGGAHDLPAGLVAPTSGELHWLVDRAAAARLGSQPRGVTR